MEKKCVVKIHHGFVMFRLCLFGCCEALCGNAFFGESQPMKIAIVCTILYIVSVCHYSTDFAPT